MTNSQHKTGLIAKMRLHYSFTISFNSFLMRTENVFLICLPDIRPFRLFPGILPCYACRGQDNLTKALNLETEGEILLTIAGVLVIRRLL